MKKRSEIDNKYKWDFSDYFASDDEWQKTFDSCSKEIKKVTTYSGKLNDEKTILSCFRFIEKMSLVLESLAIYASCNHDLNVADDKYQAMLGKIENLATTAGEMSSFITPQLCALDEEFLRGLLAKKTFAPYASSIKDVLRDKPHTLSEDNEKLLSMTGNFAGDFSTCHSNFENGDLKFNKVKNAKGKLLDMDQNLASIYLRDNDSVLRENAYKELQGAYGRYNNFLFANYLGSVKGDMFYAKARHFSSALEKALYYEEISPKVYTNLLKNVDSNLALDHEYFALKKKMLGLKTFKLSDVYYNPMKLNKKYTYEQAMDTVYSALSLLGKDYVQELKNMAANRQIDVFPTENKRGGAYETMATRKTPRVLANFMGSFNDVSTLAHELGHAMHSVYSDRAQSIDNAGYTIFLAEIASTVNETILSKYMIAHAQSKQEKMYFINEYLSEFHATVFRQTMFASFEEQIHSRVENGQDLSAKIVNDIYFDLVSKYFGKGVKLFKEVQYEWSRIPHFYTPFYVYKYATGIISAINIVENLSSGKITVDDYKKFLSSGCIDTPTKLLKIVKVDFDTEEPFAVAFDYIKTMLKDLKSLLTTPKK